MNKCQQQDQKQQQQQQQQQKSLLEPLFVVNNMKECHGRVFSQWLAGCAQLSAFYNAGGVGCEERWRRH